jgi:hypothetical protein
MGENPPAWGHPAPATPISSKASSTMLRTEIVRGLANILAAVEDSNVLSVVERVYRELSRQGGEVKMPELLESYQKFLLAYNSSFTPTERQMMKVLDVAEFADSEWWSVVIAAAGAASKSPDAAAAIGRPLFKLRFVADYLPNVIALVRRDSDPDAHAIAAEIHAGGTRPGHLMLILPEEANKFSSPLRVTSAIESIVLLYEAFGELSVQSSTDLVIKSLDSGVDKMLEFQGLPDLVDRVKELLLDLWDNVIYYREKRFAERLDLASKNLPILAEIAGLEEKSQLQPERAELLRRKFTQGANKFFETGSSIPEMNKFSNYVPRQLLSPKETLLLQASVAG